MLEKSRTNDFQHCYQTLPLQRKCNSHVHPTKIVYQRVHKSNLLNPYNAYINSLRLPIFQVFHIKNMIKVASNLLI